MATACLRTYIHAIPYDFAMQTIPTPLHWRILCAVTRPSYSHFKVNSSSSCIDAINPIQGYTHTYVVCSMWYIHTYIHFPKHLCRLHSTV